tara:strand:- start:5 stop:178 length:174 start_codon:yes stop_codon:yes gene_type:complete
MSRPKWNAYMREYRKRDYVKKKTHEYYLNRIIKQAEKDNEKLKNENITMDSRLVGST